MVPSLALLSSAINLPAGLAGASRLRATPFTGGLEVPVCRPLVAAGSIAGMDTRLSSRPFAWSVAAGSRRLATL